MSDVITVEGLHKTYGDEIAVDEIDFAVKEGEIFGLLGPNGAGKTTTVECLQGLRTPDRGRVSVLGIDPSTHADRLRARIGSQLQSSALPERLRVGEAVRLFARLHDQRVHTPTVLEMWDLEGLARRPFAGLSGGQKQRLFLALALLGDPEVVFLDELTTGLDPNARRETWNLVNKVRERGATVVLVTHFMEEAEVLCDRVAIIDRGNIVGIDSPAGLIIDQGNEVRITFTLKGHDPGFINQIPGVRSLSMADGVANVVGTPDTAISVAAALSARDMAPLDYRTHHPSLEDVFLGITGRRLANGETP